MENGKWKMEKGRVMMASAFAVFVGEEGFGVGGVEG